MCSLSGVHELWWIQLMNYSWLFMKCSWLFVIVHDFMNIVSPRILHKKHLTRVKGEQKSISRLLRHAGEHQVYSSLVLGRKKKWEALSTATWVLLTSQQRMMFHTFFSDFSPIFPGVLSGTCLCVACRMSRHTLSS